MGTFSREAFLGTIFAESTILIARCVMAPHTFCVKLSDPLTVSNNDSFIAIQLCLTLSVSNVLACSICTTFREL